MLGYHEITASPERNLYNLRPEQFRQHLLAILPLLKASQLPVVSFDDGHESQFEQALPLLTDTGVCAMYFVPTGMIGTGVRAMSWADVREVKRAGHSIGSHGRTHRLLTHCMDDELEAELLYSRIDIEQAIGARVDAISMPGGRCDARVLRACWRAGYARVYTSKPGESWTCEVDEEYPSVEATRRVIGRLVVRRSMSTDLLSRYLKGDEVTRAQLRLEYACKQSVKTCVGDRIYGRVWRSMLRPGG